MGSNGHRPQRRALDLRGLLRGRRRVAFVLSGGGSLGATQVGMLRALFEAGIEPDMVVGTSVGSVNAAWVGAWPALDGIERLAEIWLGLKRDDVFPLGWTAAMGLLGRGKHLISSESLRRVLDRHLPLERLEQGRLPVHVVTTELRSGRAVVISSGPTVPALLASCAIPGVFPPVRLGRRELIDGGVANHAPISVAYEKGARVIYVLPVGYPWLHQAPSNVLGMALQALARLVEQRLESEVAAYRDLADIRVVEAVDPLAVSPADFSHTRELMDRGHASALRLLRGEVAAKVNGVHGDKVRVRSAEAAA